MYGGGQRGDSAKLSRKSSPRARLTETNRRRNRFDCFVVLMSWVLYIYALLEGGSSSNLARSARVIRLARPISLLRKARSARLKKVFLPCNFFRG